MSEILDELGSESTSEYVCPECGKECATPGTLGLHRYQKHGVAGSTPPKKKAGTARRRPGPKPGTPRQPAAAPSITELFTPDAEPEPKRKRIGGWFTRTKAPARPGQPRPQRPKAERKQPSRRKPLDKGIGFAWGNVLAPLAYASGKYPVGRVLEAQAPAAGIAFDALVKGTFIDKLIQPLAAETDKWGAVGYIAALPMAMLAYSSNPNPMTEQMLRWVLKPNMLAMADAVEHMQAEAEEFGESVKKLEEVGMVAPGDPDPMGSFIQMLMAPPPGAPEPEVVTEVVVGV